jgi:cyclohexadienyl dehydratase
MIRERLKMGLLIALLTICASTCLAACCSNEDNGKVAEITERGTILFGTTGDYRPLSFCEADGTYWGFEIEMANEIAKRLGVALEFKKTSWPTLTADVLTKAQLFDLAIGGITITDTRRETMLMSEG